MFQNIRRGDTVRTFLRCGQVSGVAVQENTFTCGQFRTQSLTHHGRDAASQHITAAGRRHSRVAA